MTPQEAIKRLKHHFALHDDGRPTPYLDEATHMAIKALEKQIWISTKDRLPNDMEIVNITWVNRNPAPYYAHIKDVPMVATGLVLNGEWYWFSCYSEIIDEYKHLANADRIDKDIEIIAWLPLPSPYKESDTDE